MRFFFIEIPHIRIGNYESLKDKLLVNSFLNLTLVETTGS